MATYLSPGVYVQEVDSGPKPIAGVPTAVAALVGATEKGPVLEPTRLTSWNDYLETFGGPIPGSYTAESAFGFFQNGGNALWVTRADRATLSRWEVGDGDGAAAFTIEAASPGAWSADMRLAVTRSTAGGQGQLFAARVTGPGADLDLAAAGTHEVKVDSVTGALAGMPVAIADVTAAARVEATIEEVGTDALKLRVTGGGRTVRIADDPRVSARIDSGQTQLRLASGTGFIAGDVIMAAPPSGAAAGAAVQRVGTAGTGPELTLAPGFGADLDGLTFARRTFAVPVDVAPGAGADPHEVDRARVTAIRDPLPDALVRLTLDGGLSADWGADSFDFPDGTNPAGRGSAAGFLDVVPYGEDVDVTITAADAADDATLGRRLGRFDFVPAGATLTLTSAGGTSKDFVRTATGWEQPADAAGTYTRAEVSPTTAKGLKTTSGLVVTAPRAPEPGDYVDFPGAIGARAVKTVPLTVGAPPGVHVLTFEADFQPAGTRWPVKAWLPTRVHTLRFGISATRETPAGVESETYTELSLNPAHPRYYLADGIINSPSRMIRVAARTATTALTDPDSLPATLTRLGTGGAGVLDTQAFSDALEQLERASEPSLIAAPDALTLGDSMLVAAVFKALARHAQDFRRFAVIDLPPELKDTALLEWRMLHLDSTHAAAYAPFVRMPNLRRPQVPLAVDVPPSGFVMGVYARTDNDRGVWKAPANERVEGISQPVVEYTQRRQDLLNPRGINLLRPFAGRGTRIWGARNLTDDTAWRYVNVRRLFLYLENSIDAGTQWVVFEPNNETTWLRVRVSVEDFLNQVWRAGGLAGSTAEQAYRVRCGLGSTMTEADMALGLLIIEVAVAPVYPAEFVVFRISQKRQAE